MRIQRLGLATAVVAITALPACSMWHSMTDRITGRGQGTTTASTPRGGTTAPGATGYGPGAAGAGGSTMSGATAGTTGSTPGTTTGTTPGGSMTALPGMPTTDNASIPNFRSYNECRAWLARMPADSTALNRGTMQGGEVTLADQDLCRRFPRG